MYERTGTSMYFRVTKRQDRSSLMENIRAHAISGLGERVNSGEASKQTEAE